MATSQRDGYTAGLARSLMKGVERWQFIVDECPTALLRIFASSFFVHKYDPLPPARTEPREHSHLTSARPEP